MYPYYFTFTTFTKGRWVGEKILDVFAREFRAHPAEEYVSEQMNEACLSRSFKDRSSFRKSRTCDRGFSDRALNLSGA